MSLPCGCSLVCSCGATLEDLPRSCSASSVHSEFDAEEESPLSRTVTTARSVILRHGWMEKRKSNGLMSFFGAKNLLWDRRFFVLTDSSLSYYQPNDDTETRLIASQGGANQRKGVVTLESMTAVRYERTPPGEADHGTIVITVHDELGHPPFELRASTREDTAAWLAALCDPTGRLVPSACADRYQRALEAGDAPALLIRKGAGWGMKLSATAVVTELSAEPDGTVGPAAAAGVGIGFTVMTIDGNAVDSKDNVAVLLGHSHVAASATDLSGHQVTAQESGMAFVVFCKTFRGSTSTVSSADMAARKERATAEALEASALKEQAQVEAAALRKQAEEEAHALKTRAIAEAQERTTAAERARERAVAEAAALRRQAEKEADALKTRAMAEAQQRTLATERATERAVVEAAALTERARTEANAVKKRAEVEAAATKTRAMEDAAMQAAGMKRQAQAEATALKRRTEADAAAEALAGKQDAPAHARKQPSCDLFKNASAFLETLKIDSNYLEPAFDRCYCEGRLLDLLTQRRGVFVCQLTR